MTVRLYQSTDASAPTLSGSAGALLTVLDAVLVNGYGSQTAAGWTIAFTGTNQRQYAPAAGGSGCQLYINDAAPGAGTGKEARFNGFKTGTALGAGTGQFPTTGQMSAPSGALVIRKSTTADATARAWTIIADGNTIYMFIETGDSVAPIRTYPWMFGDFFSYASGDTNNCLIIGRTKENVANAVNTTISANILWGSQVAGNCAENFMQLCGGSNTIFSDVLYGHYVCSNFNGVGGSLPVGKHSDTLKMGYPNLTTTGTAPQMGYCGAGPGAGTTLTVWPNAFNYPNPADGGLYVAPIWVHHNGGIRGYLKGLWNPLQHVPLQHRDTYSGSNNMSGKSLIAMNILGAAISTAANDATCQVHVEYSNTWS